MHFFNCAVYLLSICDIFYFIDHMYAKGSMHIDSVFILVINWISQILKVSKKYLELCDSLDQEYHVISLSIKIQYPKELRQKDHSY